MISAQSIRGFTLIELLIVVSLVTILSGSLLPGFSRYILNQNLRQAIEQVEDDLRTIENKALTGDSALTLVSGNPPLYWGVQFTSGSDRYDYFISNTNTQCLPSNYVSKGGSTKLPGDNVIRSATRCIFFSFKNSDSNTRSSGGSVINPGVVIIGPVGGSVCKRIQINSVGLIEVLENNQACN